MALETQFNSVVFVRNGSSDHGITTWYIHHALRMSVTRIHGGFVQEDT